MAANALFLVSSSKVRRSPAEWQTSVDWPSHWIPVRKGGPRQKAELNGGPMKSQFNWISIRIPGNLILAFPFLACHCYHFLYRWLLYIAYSRPNKIPCDFYEWGLCHPKISCCLAEFFILYKQSSAHFFSIITPYFLFALHPNYLVSPGE